MTQQFLKGLLMAIMAVAITAFSTPPLIWSVFAITLAGAILVYSGKNAILILHSDSPVGSLNFVNILSALFIAIGMAITEVVASIAGTGVIDWKLLLKVVLGVTFTYLGSTVFAGPYSLKKNKLIQ